MKIIDTSAANYLLKNIITINRDDIFFVSEDIRDEIELSAQMLNVTPLSNIHLISEVPEFSIFDFYINYKDMLNKHSGYSFSNLTGLGDISLLAAIKTLVAKQSKLAFSESDDDIEVYTDDAGLIKRISSEFSQYKNIFIYRPVGNSFKKA